MHPSVYGCVLADLCNFCLYPAGWRNAGWFESTTRLVCSVAFKVFDCGSKFDGTVQAFWDTVINGFCYR